MIVDENKKLFLTEANTQPGNKLWKHNCARVSLYYLGLDWTNPTMPDGRFNPEIERANDITAGIINDSLNVLGFKDNVKFYKQGCARGKDQTFEHFGRFLRNYF